MTVPWLGARRKRRGRRETFAAGGGCENLLSNANRGSMSAGVSDSAVPQRTNRTSRMELAMGVSRHPEPY
jgi:hypothetical protein